jgi:UDP-N-acetyl-D-mannosaminuronic acid transferase (WecB/TagA/CpsF family)
MRTDILGVGYDNVTWTRAVSRAIQLIEERSGTYVVTPNRRSSWPRRRRGH